MSSCYVQILQRAARNQVRKYGFRARRDSRNRRGTTCCRYRRTNPPYHAFGWKPSFAWSPESRVDHHAQSVTAVFPSAVGDSPQSRYESEKDKLYETRVHPIGSRRCPLVKSLNKKPPPGVSECIRRDTPRRRRRRREADRPYAPRSTRPRYVALPVCAPYARGSRCSGFPQPWLAV